MMNSGKNKLFYSVLDEDRIKLLDKLSAFKDNFYLAGGTALALQIGHRISVDFDFFTSDHFENEKLIKTLKTIFDEYAITIIQNEIDTLTVLLNDRIKISFFNLPYKNILPLIDTKFFNLAQIKEIAIMKFLALFRATYKDYVDLYFILKNNHLKELIALAKTKHPEFDEANYVRALISYDDIDDFPISFMPGYEISRDKVFSFIELKTVEYIKSTG